MDLAGLVDIPLQLVGSITPEHVMQYASAAFSHQVTQFLTAFSVAAWIHSGRMKKEFRALTLAVTDLGAALRSDLNTLGNRVGSVEQNVGKIVERVEQLEKPTRRK